MHLGRTVLFCQMYFRNEVCTRVHVICIHVTYLLLSTMHLGTSWCDIVANADSLVGVPTSNASHAANPKQFGIVSANGNLLSF